MATGGKKDSGTIEMFEEFRPRVRFEPTVIPEGNGQYRVIAGKPIVESGEPEISMPEFLRRVKARGGRLSERYAQQLCDEGRIRARKLVADKEKSQWRILATEVERFAPAMSREETKSAKPER